MYEKPPPPRPKIEERLKVDLITTTRRALALVWGTSRRLSIAMAIGTLVASVLPAAIAYVGKLLVDAIVGANRGTHATDGVVPWLVLELVLVVLLAANQRLLGIFRSLLRAQLGHRVSRMILEKALEFELANFEDSEMYDRITRARREATQRPLSLVMRTFDAAQATLSLTMYGFLLVDFSPLAVMALAVAGVPSFIGEAKFAGDAFRIFRSRTPETREQGYLETVLAREDHVREVKLFDVGRRFLNRYVDIFQKLYVEDRRLTLRRGFWGLGLGMISTIAFYGVYAWIAFATVAGTVTLGGMTMYLAVFRQGQAALTNLLGAVGGLYEDNLYLSSLYELLDAPVERPPGSLDTDGPLPDDGLRFEHVCFTYPGASEAALTDVSFHIPAGRKLAIVGENGSGKTTLVKLLARFYEPTSGRILYAGRDLRQWEPVAFRRRIGVIFQDFLRYQMTVGENIGAGDEQSFEDRARWAEAAKKGLAAPFIDTMEHTYDTQLGRWFRNGRELSFGQWQKIALARAFMRNRAEILVLDEPTSSMDAAAEVKVFDHFREMTGGQIAIVISHRFSTVRKADVILVLDRGRVIESGTHEALVAQRGPYATLFELQAAGYR